MGDEKSPDHRKCRLGKVEKKFIKTINYKSNLEVIEKCDYLGCLGNLGRLEKQGARESALA